MRKNKLSKKAFGGLPEGGLLLGVNTALVGSSCLYGFNFIPFLKNSF
jgi:hypothetical protein